MTDQEEKEARDAAAFWLFGERGVRGEWAKLNGPWPATGLERGASYRIRSHDPKHKTLGLEVEGGVANINITYLTVQADTPEKTIVWSEGNWADRPAETKYVGRCPKGHKQELGATPPSADTCACPNCGSDYEWEYEK